MRPGIVTLRRYGRFAFADPTVVVAMVGLAAALALPKVLPSGIQKNAIQSTKQSVTAEGSTVKTGGITEMPAGADLPAGIHLGSYGPFRIDDLP